MKIFIIWQAMSKKKLKHKMYINNLDSIFGKLDKHNS